MKSILMMVVICGCIFQASCRDNVNKGNTSRIIQTEDDTTWGANGQIEKVVSYGNDNEISIMRLYGSNKLRKLIKYQKIKGKLAPNQLIVFDEHEDTLYDKSIFYSIYCIDDSISKSEKYQFKIVLNGHLLDSALLYLCDYDSDFNLRSDTLCNVLRMKNFEGPPLSKEKAHLGWNYIRGRIDNYMCFPQVKDKNGEDSCSIVEVYFVDSFYVKE